MSVTPTGTSHFVSVVPLTVHHGATLAPARVTQATSTTASAIAAPRSHHPHGATWRRAAMALEAPHVTPQAVSSGHARIRGEVASSPTLKRSARWRRLTTAPRSVARCHDAVGVGVSAGTRTHMLLHLHVLWLWSWMPCAALLVVAPVCQHRRVRASTRLLPLSQGRVKSVAQSDADVGRMDKVCTRWG